MKKYMLNIHAIGVDGHGAAAEETISLRWRPIALGNSIEPFKLRYVASINLVEEETGTVWFWSAPIEEEETEEKSNGEGAAQR